ncbi:MAG: ABC transporter ATP-binding protein [Planctomycetes bacterium]|nr:ABC transporter ATP-binding protein [Planctomycetota bacterium]
MSDANGDAILEVKNLRTGFFTDDGVVMAVDDVSYPIYRGKTLGLVGESGCGKSVTALSIMRLLSYPGRIIGGQILFEGEDLAVKPDGEMREIRGNKISMIFQEPMTSLNPVFTIGSQISEAVVLHQKKSKREARDRTIEMLQLVKIPAAETRVDEYPHQMSGGMRQRVMIAMALACNPALLIADEPSTALDVTIQAQILDLMSELQQKLAMSILIITHDLGVIAEVADYVAVMYASKVVEYADVRELFAKPMHPYTQGLFRSRPAIGTPKGKKLSIIPGTVPNPLHFPKGCKFHTRCPIAVEACKVKEPDLRELAPGHWVRCDLAKGAQP